MAGAVPSAEIASRATARPRPEPRAPLPRRRCGAWARRGSTRPSTAGVARRTLPWADALGASVSSSSASCRRAAMTSTRRKYTSANAKGTAAIAWGSEGRAPRGVKVGLAARRRTHRVGAHARPVAVAAGPRRGCVVTKRRPRATGRHPPEDGARPARDEAAPADGGATAAGYRGTGPGASGRAAADRRGRTRGTRGGSRGSTRPHPGSAGRQPRIDGAAPAEHRPAAADRRGRTRGARGGGRGSTRLHPRSRCSRRSALARCRARSGRPDEPATRARRPGTPGHDASGEQC